MPIFVFYIEGEEMYAEEGMKWEAWVESRYNTLNLFWNGDNNLQRKHNSREHLSWVAKYKLITEGYNYKFTYDVEIEA
jgi:hypothetical protein